MEMVPHDNGLSRDVPGSLSGIGPVHNFVVDSPCIEDCHGSVLSRPSKAIGPERRNQENHTLCAGPLTAGSSSQGGTTIGRHGDREHRSSETRRRKLDEDPAASDSVRF